MGNTNTGPQKKPTQCTTHHAGHTFHSYQISYRLERDSITNSQLILFKHAADGIIGKHATQR